MHREKVGREGGERESSKGGGRRDSVLTAGIIIIKELGQRRLHFTLNQREPRSEGECEGPEPH